MMNKILKHAAILGAVHYFTFNSVYWLTHIFCFKTDFGHWQKMGFVVYFTVCAVIAFLFGLLNVYLFRGHVAEWAELFRRKKQ